MQALLEKVLSAGKSDVITATVDGLGTREAGALFQALVDRLQSRPASGAQLLPWLRAVLLAHSTILAATPAGKRSLTQLQRAVDARVASLQPLLAIQGRLDFVLAQNRRRAAIAAGTLPMGVRSLACLHWSHNKPYACAVLFPACVAAFCLSW